MQCAAPRVILASASSSRRSLLSSAGVAFDIRPADIDEAAIKRGARSEGLKAEDAALRLADLKAVAISGIEPEAVVIGADQILVCDGIWYDKPDSVAEARKQLLALRGRSHVLATAAVCYEGGRRVWHDIAMPCLRMRPFSDDFLDDYLANEVGSVTTTVGAYRLEARGVQLFDAIEGDHFAILGLPLLPLLAFLRRRCVLLV